MYYNTLSYKDIVTISNCSFLYKSEKRNELQTRDQQNRSAVSKNVIPTDYKLFFFTMLSSQDKWNLVFEKAITKLDELDQLQIVEVKERQKEKK